MNARSGHRRVVVAAVHAAPVFLDADATVDRACALIAQASDAGAELVVFPEVFVPGFPYFINCYAPDVQTPLLVRYADASIQLPGPELARLQEGARSARINVVIGVSERDGGTLYNSQVFLNRAGCYLGKHRKLQPTFAERFVWGQGDGSTLQVLDTDVGKVGGLICWEHTMNLARQALILKGEQIHAASWPGLESAANLVGYFDMQVEALSRVHALTGQCFVVVAGSPVGDDVLKVMEDTLGPQPHLAAGGGWSAIVHPMGNYLAGPHTGGQERVLTAELDFADIAALKTLVDAGGHYARREVLSLVVDERPYAALRSKHAQAAPPPKPPDSAAQVE